MAALTWETRRTFAAVSAGLIAVLCGLPLLLLVIEAVTAIDGAAWLRSGMLLLRSLLLGAAAAALAVALGGIAAASLNRSRRRWVGLLFAILLIPLLLPSYIQALTWSNLLSDGYWLKRPLAPGATDSGWLLSIWVLGISYYPIAMLVVLAALRRWDERYSASAWANGQAPEAVRRLRLQYLRAPLLTAAFVSFLLAFADFAVPDFFQVSTYATDVFIQVSSYLDTSRAMALVLPVMVIAFLTLIALARASKRLALTTSYGASVDALSPNNVGSSNVPLLSWFMAITIVLVPVANLIRMTGNFRSWEKAFWMVLGDAAAGYALSIATALVAVSSSVFAAYGLQRRMLRGAFWLRLIPCALFAVPASLLGLVTIRSWNPSSAAGWAYDCGLALLVALTARWLPIGLEILIGGWRQVGHAQEEAAMACGVPWSTTFFRILLPQIWPAISVALLLTMIFAFNELTLVTLLAPPGFSTLTLRVFQTVHYGAPSLLAAICLWHLLFLLLPSAALFVIAARWRGRWIGP